MAQTAVDLVMDTTDSLPWVEKYRPKLLDEVAGHEGVVQTIRNFIKKGQLPHLLFYGPPGTGKTSTVTAIARELYGNDYKRMVLELNASDDRGIDVVRNDIKNFASTQHMFASHHLKLIVLDEADHMTSVAQNALRRTMEKYSSSTRFCLLANYSHKLNPALISRCSRHRFSPLSPDALRDRVRYVIDQEHVDIEPEAVEGLLNQSGGDMRRVLGVLQACNQRIEKTITTRDIYDCLGTPDPQSIERILYSLLNESYDVCISTINTLKSDNGFALADILTAVGKEMQFLDTLTVEERAKILSGLSDIEFRLSGGGSEKIQTSAMVGVVKSSIQA